MKTLEASRATRNPCLAVLLAMASLPGCAGHDAADEEVTPGAPSSDELSIGSTGDEVRAVHDYLADYGYFPSERLATEYSQYEPIVATAPADPEVFDEALAEAVRKFQENSGLAPTGIVDTATKAKMHRERCAAPDGRQRGPVADPSASDVLVEKFAAHPVSKQDFTWSVESWPAGMSEQTFINHVQSAFNKWKTVYDSNLPRVARGQGNVKIFFTTIDGPPVDTNGDQKCDSGCVAGRWNPAFRRIEIDRDEPFVFSGHPTQWPQVSFQATVIHEIGHALGFDHSTSSLSVMYGMPSRGTTLPLSLSSDDRVGVRAAFGVWTTVWTPAPVFNFGIGATNTGTSNFFIITGEPAPGGFKIYVMRPDMWMNVPGGALSIAGDARGRAWITDSNGNISYSKTNGSGWRTISACATDIDVATAGPVVFKGCDGHAWLTKLDTSKSDAEIEAQIALGGTRIALPGNVGIRSVAAYVGGWSSVPLAVSDGQGRLWLRWSADWLEIETDDPFDILDLAVINDSLGFWATRAGSPGVFARNEQRTVPIRSGWVGTSAVQAVRVDATYDGRPYVMTTNGTLMTTTK